MNVRNWMTALLLIASMDSEGASRVASDYAPGEIVPETEVTRIGLKSFFSVETIPDSIFQAMQGKSFKKDCTVRRDLLRYVRCLHKDLQGHSIVGEMIVNQKIAMDVVDILLQLYEASYPIERMRLIDYYDADDEASMQANNSSAFNFRFISHTHRVSKHGLGLAVDINPLYNPYHKTLANGTEIIEPAESRAYLDRSKSFNYKIEKGDLCYRLFILHGFTWGGNWRTCKDWQHFEMK